MKFLKHERCLRNSNLIYFFKGTEGGDGLPEGPKDYRSLAIDTIKATQTNYFSNPECGGYKFLQAAERFIISLPVHPDEQDAIPLAFFVYAQIGLVYDNVLEFLEHIELQVNENPLLKSAKELRDAGSDSIEAQKKYYDGLFAFWHSHEIFLKALEKVSRRK